MPPLQRLVLSPADKFRYYGVVPYKFFIHILVCLISVIMTIGNTQHDAPFVRRTAQLFCHQVMPSAFGGCMHGDDVFPANIIGFNIYNEEDFLESLRKASGVLSKPTFQGTAAHIVFPTMNNSTTLVQRFYKDFPRNFGEIVNGRMHQSIALNQEEITLSLSHGSIGPFEEDAQYEIRRTVKLRLEGHFQAYRFGDRFAHCITFLYQVKYDFTNRGAINQHVQISPDGMCADDFDDIGNVVVLNYVNLVVSGLLLVLYVRSMWRRYSLIQLVNKSDQLKMFFQNEENDENDENAENVKLSSCMQCRVFVPFDYWTMIFSLVIMTFQSLLYILEPRDGTVDSLLWRSFNGLALVLLWYSLKRYMSSHASYRGIFLLFAILDNSMQTVATFMLSCLPMILGFTLAGMVLFSPGTLLFANLSRAFATLFCIANGDSMIPIFESVWWVSGVAGYVYIYAWVCFIM